jgi:putative membrane protein
MQGLGAMFVHRPYVIAFFVAFAVLVWCERGPLRAALWLVSGTFIGWLSEFCSVSTGFPFGNYAYHKEQFAGEIWLGPVPLFASVSFAFMGYFSFSAARRLLAPWSGAGMRLATRDVEALDGTVRALLLAAVVGTWMDSVIDPMTLVGQYWFLGDLYHYDPPGPHFGVPLANYGGWMITIGAIVLANQMLDRLLVRIGIPLSRGPALPFESFWGIACCTGVFGFMLAVNVVLLARGTVPDTVPLGRILVSGLALSGLFLALVVVMIRRGLTRSRSGTVRPAVAAAGAR